MRLCIDIDGTLCELRQAHQSYADVVPLPGAVEQLKALRSAGHYIILATARHMKTCEANVGMVIARQGKILLQWLEDHQIEYDEIWFGKPNADIYIDDRGYRFNGNWHDINLDQLSALATPEVIKSKNSSSCADACSSTELKSHAQSFNSVSLANTADSSRQVSNPKVLISENA